MLWSRCHRDTGLQPVSLFTALFIAAGFRGWSQPRHTTTPLLPQTWLFLKFLFCGSTYTQVTANAWCEIGSRQTSGSWIILLWFYRPLKIWTARQIISFKTLVPLKKSDKAVLSQSFWEVGVTSGIHVHDMFFQAQKSVSCSMSQ